MTDADKAIEQMRFARDFIDNNRTGLNITNNFDRLLTQIEVAQAASMGTIAAKHAMRVIP
jgi:hypothetical protein